MINEIVWAGDILVNFLLVIAVYKLFGKIGLYIWIPISAILANIQVVQTISLFGMAATLGNNVYASSFLVTDILSENHGKEDAKKAIWIGFFSLLALTVLMQIALFFQPLQGDEFASTTYQSLSHIFGLMPRIALASLVAYLISQRHDIWAYHFWKGKYAGIKHIWIRNNLSTMVSQLIDTLVFCTIAFLGVFEGPVFWEVVFTTYLLKWVVAVADTPFIYWSTKIKPLNLVKE
jgi:queuosine precursor transporter